MQKNEIIIEQFIKAIKTSSLDVKGDPILLDKVFEALDKKKKRKRLLAIFMVLTVVLSGLSVAIWGNYYHNNKAPENQTAGLLIKHNTIDLNADLMALNHAKKKSEIPVKEKNTKPVVKKQERNLTVSYKFNNHQVDVFKQESEEFIQINVFGSDGSEIDVFKMMEDLKMSYRNNELFVDSVKQK